MSLTKDDLQQIGTIVKEEVRNAFDTYGRQVIKDEIYNSFATKLEPRLDKLEGHLEALNNDVKDIFLMISKIGKPTRHVAHIEKYDLEQKILTAYRDVVSIANEAGIKLPRS